MANRRPTAENSVEAGDWSPQTWLGKPTPSFLTHPAYDTGKGTQLCLLRPSLALCEVFRRYLRKPPLQCKTELNQAHFTRFLVGPAPLKRGNTQIRVNMGPADIGRPAYAGDLCRRLDQVRSSSAPHYWPPDRGFLSFFCRSANSSAIALMLVRCSRVGMVVMPFGSPLPNRPAKDPTLMCCSAA